MDYIEIVYPQNILHGPVELQTTCRSNDSPKISECFNILVEQCTVRVKNSASMPLMITWPKYS